MRDNNPSVLILLLCIITTQLSACASSLGGSSSGVKNTAERYTQFGETYHVMKSSEGYREIGVASWYGKKFHGRLTANGETYDMYGLTAAHKTLPLPTWVKVTNLDNGRKVILKVNDRGPFHDNRLIDLSWKAALELGFADVGTAPVVVEALSGESEARLTSAAWTASKPASISSTEATYYLQLGAFSQLRSAELLQERVNSLIGKHALQDINVRILQSESGETVLHKVWIGPILDEIKRDLLALWVQEMNLGMPVRVQVD